MRCGDAYAQLAAGFGIGIATVYRYIREAVEALPTLAPTLTEAMRTIREKTFVILDGTLLPIHHRPPPRRRPFYASRSSGPKVSRPISWARA